jgi:hypothetical protein
MSSAPDTQNLNQMSLAAFRPLFGRLAAPTPEALPGAYAATFVGPAWVRRFAGPALAIVGLRGWCGKRILAGGHAMNLVCASGEIVETLPMTYELVPARIDGAPCARMTYPVSSRLPWPWIIDELRAWDADHLLGLTMLDRLGLARFAFPFLLTRADPLSTAGPPDAGAK